MVEISDTFWITAGQAGALVGGMVVATVAGAGMVRANMERMIDPDFEEEVGLLDKDSSVQQGPSSLSSSRTRLSAEDVLGDKLKQDQISDKK